MALISHLRSPYFSTLMVVPFPTAFVTGFLQMTNQSRLVASYFCILVITKINTAREYY